MTNSLQEDKAYLFLFSILRNDVSIFRLLRRRQTELARQWRGELHKSSHVQSASRFHILINYNLMSREQEKKQARGTGVSQAATCGRIK